MSADEWANCAECGQARPRRMLSSDRLCPWCALTVVLATSNPLLPDLFHDLFHENRSPYTIDGLFTLRDGGKRPSPPPGSPPAAS